MHGTTGYPVHSKNINSVVLIPITRASLNKRKKKKKSLNSYSNPGSGVLPKFQGLTSQAGCHSALSDSLMQTQVQII